MNATKHISTMLALAMLLMMQPGQAQEKSIKVDPPPTITYQGLITTPDGAPTLDGEYSITVTLYGDEHGAERIWQETSMAPVRNGVFDLQLGAGEHRLPDATAMDRPLWAGVRIEGGPEMRPLTRLSASPFAVNVADAAITAEKIAPGAVTADKVDMDYVREIRINGERVGGKAAALNITGAGIVYDRASGSLTIDRGASAASAEKRGAGTLGTTNDFWTLQGDGRTDNGGVVAPLNTDWIGTSNASGGANFTVKVNSQQVMKYQPNGTNTPNIVGGHSSNSITATVSGSTIAGGGAAAVGLANTIQADYGFIGGGTANLIATNRDHSVIGGGDENEINGAYGVIGGGNDNFIDTVTGSFIGGGDDNIINARSSVISGGGSNRILALSEHSVVGGGSSNAIASIPGASYATIGGGNFNQITQGWATTIPGGEWLRAQSYGQTVIGFGNIPRGSVALRPSTAIIATRNDPLFIVGNGDVNVPTPSNAFEVSYNGHSTVFDVNGSRMAVGGRDPIKGSTYVDNVIYAWGYVNGGAVVSDFGVSSITPLGVGIYRIAFKVVDPITGAQVALTNASVTATLVDTGVPTATITCGTIKTTPVVTVGTDLNTFIVKTASGSTCTMANLPFMFKVTGRP